LYKLHKSISSAALSFMVAEMFDQAIDIQQITTAARYGRTVGECASVSPCSYADGQLRTLSDYVASVDDFFSSLLDSISNSINLGKK